MSNVASIAQAPGQRRRFDLSGPIFLSLAVLLCVLVILPLFWLLVYSFTDKAGSFTLDNFATLVTDRAMRRSFGLAIGMALGVGALACLVATPMAWLVARTDLPLRRFVRALVTASS